MHRVAFIGLTTLLTAAIFHVLSLGAFDAVLSTVVILIAIIADLLRCMFQNTSRKVPTPDLDARKQAARRFLSAGLVIGAATGPPIILWIVIAPQSFVDTVVSSSGVRWEWISYDYVGPILAQFPVFSRFAEWVADDRQTVLALKLGFAIFFLRTLLACYLVPLLAAVIFRGEGGDARSLKSMRNAYLLPLILVALVTLIFWISPYGSISRLGRLVYVSMLLDVAVIAAICNLAAQSAASRIQR